MEQPPKRGKRKNDVEKFYEEHTIEFDKRAQSTTSDPMKAVEDQYDTAPRMKNELQRRKSLADPKIIKDGDRHILKAKSAASHHHTTNCPTCQCLKILSGLKKLKLKKACHCARKRLTKPSPRTRKRQPLAARHANLALATISSNMDLKAYGNVARSERSSRYSGLSEKSARITKKAVKLRSDASKEKRSRCTERTSITSYFSYGSMAHEPMCRGE